MSRKFEYDAGVDIAGTPYRVVWPLGAGGMGAVYEVEDLSVGRRFVMKTLHPELRDRADFVRRMQKEARILARLNHPNIVQVFTAGVTADALKLPYYIMERLEGQNLRMLIDAKGALPLHACYTIGIELLDALDRAHELGVIHRDVKPENVFIHRNGDGTATTKLLDFGIMSLLEGEGRETGRRFIGTMRYAAPEQGRGEKVTPLADLYAAGLVLYEMVAGRGPFVDAVGVSELLEAHLTRVPPTLSSLAACPPELEAVVMSALAKRPEDRPRDAFTFAAVLRNLKKRSRAAGEPLTVRESMTADGVVLALTGSTPQPAPITTPSPAVPSVVAPPRAVGAVAERAELPRAAVVAPGAAAGLGEERRVRRRRAVAASLAGAFVLTAAGAFGFAALRWMTGRGALGAVAAQAARAPPSSASDAPPISASAASSPPVSAPAPLAPARASAAPAPARPPAGPAPRGRPLAAPTAPARPKRPGSGI